MARSLPSRLLEITLIDGLPRVRLVRGQDLAADSRYATLSYCWGGLNPIMLQHENIEEFSIAVPWDLLPQTFEDTLWLTARLDIRYLWIDALCIIQDDTLDWSTEAAHMMTVYANSAVNIMADGSRNSEEGLFRPRKLETERAFHWRSRVSEGSKQWLGYTNFFGEQVSGSPLNQRAWVVQERFLAPRALHFASNGCTFWECAALTASEVLPMDMDLELTGHQSPKRLSGATASRWADARVPREIYGVWVRFADIYSGSNLSIEADRSIAISGLAQVIRQHLGLQPTDYLAGLWRPRFVQDLMWQRWRYIGEISDRGPTNSCPSWSWLSTVGGVNSGWYEYGGRALEGDLVQTVTELLDAGVTTRGSEAFGFILDGHATLRGPLCKAVLTPAPGPYQYGAHKLVDHSITLDGRTLAQQDAFEFELDSNTEKGLGQVFGTDIYLLLASIGYDRNIPVASASFQEKTYSVTGIPW